MRAVWMSLGTMFLAVSLACGGASVMDTSIGGAADELGEAEIAAAAAEEMVEPTAEEAQPAADQAEPDQPVAGAVPAPTTTTTSSALTATEDKGPVGDEPVNKPSSVATAPAPVATPRPSPRPSGTAPGQIQLTTGAGIQPMVDGVPMRLTESQGYLAEVPAGEHDLEVRNLLGRVTGNAKIQVSAGRRIRYEWRRRELSLLGEVETSPMPPAFVFEMPADTTTTTSTSTGTDPAKGGKK